MKKIVLFLVFTSFSLQIYSSNDLCISISNIIDALLKEDMRLLGEKITEEKYKGVIYDFPILMKGATDASALDNGITLEISQYFGGADYFNNSEPIFLNLIDELSMCGIHLVRNKYGTYDVFHRNFLLSLNMVEILFVDEKATLLYRVKLDIKGFSFGDRE